VRSVCGCYYDLLFEIQSETKAQKKKEKEKRNCRKKEKKVCVVIPQRVIVKERAR